MTTITNIFRDGTLLYAVANVEGFPEPLTMPLPITAHATPGARDVWAVLTKVRGTTFTQEALDNLFDPDNYVDPEETGHE